MITIVRRSVAAAAVGATFAIVACVSPTSTETDEVSAQALESIESDLTGTSAKKEEREGVDTCNPANDRHCRCAHQGWRWVEMNRTTRPGHVAGIEQGGRRRCCVRMGPDYPRGPDEACPA